jgi:Histidine kinase-, DNA gyrase B-, and HSP90-like ATPase
MAGGRMNKTSTVGTPVAEVLLDIDYEIIAHFSRHLYGSPNRAVEELVSNGFDAFATKVYVYIPGPQVTSHVVVWDNGWSMDVEQLKSLWWVARSPKASTTRVIHDANRGPDRKQIGKFGIGKLASYSVGNLISHLSRRNDDFYLVTVNYAVILGEGTQPGSSQKNPYKTQILQLTKTEARTFIKNIFDGDKTATGYTDLFDEKTWTVAVIGALKTELQGGRLQWILGNSMPERPDFSIWLNDTKVRSKLEKNSAVHWNFADEVVVQAIDKFFADAKKRGDFTGVVTFGKAVGLDAAHPKQATPYVELPSLGRIWGSIRIFDDSLKTVQSAEMGRSWGFFVMVRDRLLNPDDEKLFLNDPSFTAFYRSQFILHADALDEALLADRERLRRDTLSVVELELLQSALYRAARTEIETRDEHALAKATTVSLLPTYSRRFFREPLTALSMRSGPQTVIDITNPTVERKAIGEDQPLAIVSDETHGFIVNTSHPYYNAIAQKLGGGKKAAEFYRIYDLFSIAERLLEGHLYDVGVEDALVTQVLAWRDDLFRELAKAYTVARAEALHDLYNASYEGDKSFEHAISRVLNGMGFHAEHYGGSGNQDVLLAATVGPESYTFVFEAKGSSKPVEVDKAEVSGAASHRDAAGAEHAVIIAREFQGFRAKASNNDAAVLKECRAVGGGVSIMTVEALSELYDAIETFGYPLDMLKDIFTVVEPPVEKLARIRSLTIVTDGIDNRALLDEIWRRQSGEAAGDYVAYRSVFQSRPAWKKVGFDGFQQRLVALETLSNGRIVLNPQNQTVFLKQSPEIVAAQIELSLAKLDDESKEVS